MQKALGHAKIQTTDSTMIVDPRLQVAWAVICGVLISSNEVGRLFPALLARLLGGRLSKLLALAGGWPGMIAMRIPFSMSASLSAIALMATRNFLPPLEALPIVRPYAATGAREMWFEPRTEED